MEYRTNPAAIVAAAADHHEQFQEEETETGRETKSTFIKWYQPTILPPFYKEAVDAPAQAPAAPVKEIDKFSVRSSTEYSFTIDKQIDLNDGYYTASGERNTDVKIPDFRPATVVSSKLIDGKTVKPQTIRDDKMGRIARITEFEEAACTTQEAITNYDNFELALDTDESVVVEFVCCEVSGLPSTTTELSAKGFIKVALVKSESNSIGYRLFFSLGKGIVDISIKEKFEKSAEDSACFCCWIPCFIPPTVRNSNLDMTYKTSRDFETQFCTLPVNPCVIDAICYRAAVDKYEATTAVRKQKENDNSINWDCPCCPSYFSWCCIDCTYCCSSCSCLTKCCGLTKTIESASLSFEGTRQVIIGDSGRVGDKEGTSAAVNNVQWEISAHHEDNVFIRIYYRNLLDQANHICVLTLDGSSESYSKAQKFVALLGKVREIKFKEEANPVISVANVRETDIDANKKSRFFFG